MIESVKNVMVHAGATWVLWVLIALSVVSAAVSLDRLYAFWLRRDDVARLFSGLHERLGGGDRAGAERLLSGSRSVEAAVVAAGLARSDAGAVAAQEAMAAASGLERARLEKRLGFLGTVGNNAPFVGLLGTVIGVVGAFEELGKSTTAASAGALAPERVMGTIAEALVATAVGLVVAIPVVAVFNYFQARLTATMESAETLGHVLLSHLAAAPTGVLRGGHGGATGRGEIAAGAASKGGSSS